MSLIDAAGEALNVRGNIYYYEMEQFVDIFDERKVDILLATFELSEWRTFLLPFITLE